MNFSLLDVPSITNARRYDEVSSTMDVARELISTHATSSDWSGLVLADRQIAGRGRQGRSWHSVGGAFLATYVFCVTGGAASLSGYSLAVGVALFRALRTVGATIQLKWPNDLVVQSARELRKLGGVLIEVEAHRDFHCVLVGIGINLSAPPEEVSHIASSVTEVRGRPTGVQDILVEVSRELSVMHDNFVTTGGFKVFLDEWCNASCFRPGITCISIDGGGGEVSGVYTGLESSGALVLDLGSERRQFVSGHITSVSL